MHFLSEADAFGRLICTIPNNSQEIRVTSQDASHAAAALLAALDDTEREGCGECYWQEGGGEYRWVLRRNGDALRVAILWATGIVTGWEHVYWWEGPFDEGVMGIRNGLATLAAMS